MVPSSLSWTTAGSSYIPSSALTPLWLPERIFGNIHKVCSHQTQGSNLSSHCVSLRRNLTSLSLLVPNENDGYPENSLQWVCDNSHKGLRLPNRCSYHWLWDCAPSSELAYCHSASDSTHWPHSKLTVSLPSGKLVCVSCSVVSDSLQPQGLKSARLLCPWTCPGKNIGVGCHFLPQGIIPTQGLNPGLLHCRQILYHLSHQGSPPVEYSVSALTIQCNSTQETDSTSTFSSSPRIMVIVDLPTSCWVKQLWFLRLGSPNSSDRWTEFCLLSGLTEKGSHITHITGMHPAHACLPQSLSLRFTGASPGHNNRDKIYLQRDFSTSALVIFGSRSCFGCPFHCTMFSSIPGLTHQIPAAFLPHCKSWQSKLLQIYPNIHWGREWPWAKNYWPKSYKGHPG